jgi:mono/diheme cytochrome c family protein
MRSDRTRLSALALAAVSLFGAACAFADRFGGPPLESTAADPGQRLYENKCASCHGDGPYPGTNQISYRGAGDLPLALRPDGVPAEYVKYTVRQGRVAMPPFRVFEISDADLERIAAYLARPKK